MRQVEITRRKWVQNPKGGGGYEYPPPSSGYFHCFSTAYMEFNSGPGQYPVALVELMDGTVEEVTVDLLRFTSEPPKE